MNSFFYKEFEIIFNISYLSIIWYYLIHIFKHKEETPITTTFKLGFFWLALGDTFHVGFRVIAHLLGDINYTIPLFNTQAKLIGIGGFVTAITITLTYICFTQVWYSTYKRHHKIYYLLLLLSGLRLFIILLPQNNWYTSTTFTWSLIRNIPLLLIGILLCWVMYNNSKIDGNRFFKSFSYLIALSYAFYVPVILFVKEIPMIGMLMIPKTIIYLLMLLLVYETYFTKKTT